MLWVVIGKIFVICFRHFIFKITILQLPKCNSQSFVGNIEDNHHDSQLKWPSATKVLWQKSSSDESRLPTVKSRADKGRKGRQTSYHRSTKVSESVGLIARKCQSKVKRLSDDEMLTGLFLNLPPKRDPSVLALLSFLSGGEIKDSSILECYNLLDSEFFKTVSAGVDPSVRAGKCLQSRRQSRKTAMILDRPLDSGFDV